MKFEEWLAKSDEIIGRGPVLPLSYQMVGEDPAQPLPGLDGIPISLAELPPEQQYLLWCANEFPRAVQHIKRAMAEIDSLKERMRQQNV